MSSSRNLPSLAITFTFERLVGTRLDDEEQVCRELSATCDRLGGRVHLVKQVFAEAGTVRGMYGDIVQEAAEIRRRIGAQHVLRNEFLERTLRLDP